MIALKTIQNPWDAFHGQASQTGERAVPDSRFPVIQSRSGATGYAAVYAADTREAYREDSVPLDLPEEGEILVFRGHGSDFYRAFPIPVEEIRAARAAWKNFRRNGGEIPIRPPEFPKATFSALRRQSRPRDEGFYMTPAEGMPHDGAVWHVLSLPDRGEIFASRDGVLLPAPNGWNFQMWDEVSDLILVERGRLFPETVEPGKF